jgi:hypothetical protein
VRCVHQFIRQMRPSLADDPPNDEFFSGNGDKGPGGNEPNSEAD